MRPSSSPSEPSGAPGSSPEPTGAGGLFGPLFGHGGAADAVADAAWVRAMLDAEVALARASADAGRLDRAHAERIAAAADGLRPDPDELGRAAAAGAGNPVPALVRALTAAVDDGTAEGRAAAGAVHRGATSQDVLDTAAMLVTRRALDATLADVAGAADAAAGLARAHRDTPIVGRTLLQHAVPTTFGLKAAGWLVGLDEAAAELRRAREDAVAAQLGGAAGTLSALGADGIAVHAAYARELGLPEPTLPWHGVRVRPARIAGAVGVLGSVVAKVAGDVVLLAQTDVGEVRETDPAGARGGSSTMPHKHNPVAAITARACAIRVPGLVATLLAAGAHEHERAAGPWQAEWETLAELLRVAGAAAAWLRDALVGLRVDPERMRENLARTGGLLLTEAVTGALADAGLGRLQAHDLVTAAVGRAVEGGVDLRDALLADEAIAGALGAAGIDRALDPAGHVGAAGELVDRALVAHEAAAL
jgi:3-carboxy-cis,cis-muconate cycloisomerase